jgi:HD-GYP domain-containing protein (c-di-GMP phosphodiesterase class II)
LHHHERYDGKGYPEGLAEDAIPMGARLLAVADAFDAMSSDRPYRAALSVDYAINELKRCSGTQFCPVAVEAFVTGFRMNADPPLFISEIQPGEV